MAYKVKTWLNWVFLGHKIYATSQNGTYENKHIIHILYIIHSGSLWIEL